MLKSPYLFAVSVLIAMLQWASAAKAQNLDLGLSFELPPAQTQTTRLEATPSRAEPTRSRPERIEIAAESEPTALLATKPSDNNAELTYKAVPLPPLAVSEPASKGHLVVTARESEPVSPSGDTLGLSFSAHDISLEATAERDHQASNFHTATPDTATPDTATPNVSKPNSDIHLLFAETQDLISHAAVGSNIAPEFTEEFETDAHLEQGLLLGEASEEIGEDGLAGGE